jgi:HK97 gp10 family phage protein
MTSAVSIKVEGLSELERRLRSFGPKVAKNGLRSSNFAGVKAILNPIKKTTAFKDVSGITRASIVSPRRRGPDNIAKHSIVVRGTKKSKVTKVARSKKTGKYREIAGPAITARFLEFGTSKMAARPFIRPAVENNASAAVEAIKTGLAKACDRAAKQK